MSQRYVQSYVETQPGLATAVYKDTVTGLTVPPAKGKIRNGIQEAGIDIEDSVAANGKMISFSFSIISRLFSLLTPEQKATFPAEEVALIEYTFNKFAVTDTWADIQLAAEGTKVIDDLLTTAGTIGTIVATEKGLATPQ